MTTGSGQSIKFEMLVGVDGLIDGLKVATKGVEQSAQAIKLGLGSTGAAAKSAAKEHEGFVGTLKAFKSEQVAGGKVARYYADQIASIIPEAAGAKSAISGIAEVLTGGIGIGAGIGAATVAFSLLSDATEKAEKQAKDLKTAYLDAAQSIDKALRTVVDGLQGPLTQTAAAWKAEAAKIREEMAKTQREINEQTAKAANPGVWASIVGTAEQMFGIGSGSGKGFKSGADKDISHLQDQQLAAIQALNDKKKQRNETAAAEEVAVADAASMEAIRLRAEADERDRELGLADIARQRRAAADKLKILADYGDARRAQQVEQAKREEEAVAKLRAPWESLAESLSNTWGALMQDMITGSISFGDAMKGVFDSVLQSFLSMVTQMIAKAALIGILNFVFPGAGFTVGSTLGALGALAGVGNVARPRESPESFAASGGSGALVVNFHGAIGDAASFRAVVEHPNFAAAFREARRNGRI